MSFRLIDFSVDENYYVRPNYWFYYFHLYEFLPKRYTVSLLGYGWIGSFRIFNVKRTQQFSWFVTIGFWCGHTTSLTHIPLCGLIELLFLMWFIICVCVSSYCVAAIFLQTNRNDQQQNKWNFLSCAQRVKVLRHFVSSNWYYFKLYGKSQTNFGRSPNGEER